MLNPILRNYPFLISLGFLGAITLGFLPPVSALTLTADADADVIINGQSANAELGRTIASAGDFNGDGNPDIMVGASRTGSGTV